MSKDNDVIIIITSRDKLKVHKHFQSAV